MNECRELFLQVSVPNLQTILDFFKQYNYFLLKQKKYDKLIN